MLRLEISHEIDCVAFDRRIAFGNDQAASLALGQVGEGLGGSVVGITAGGNHSLVRSEFSVR